MGSTREIHSDGSYTDRSDTGQSVTYNPDGSVRESSKPETSWPVPSGMGPLDVQVTRDSEGNVTNRQSRK
jgi:hypothetical protein